MKTTKRKKQPAVKYETISHLSSFENNQEAQAHVFSAVLRKAQVSAYLADTGHWVVSVTEIAKEGL